MSNALKEYIVTAQNRVERALDLRLPSEKTSSPTNFIKPCAIRF